ncbi:MAG: S49 family peptidase, partial [Muribaculaceae bacterium]|nr:S49 family peptidase [Muribaculaceae bacterium]
MFKKFFISMLGTIAGLWITLLICGVVIFIAAASIISSSTPEIKIHKNSILYLDLSGSMPERYQPASLMDIVRKVEEDGESLVDIVNSINLAANDSHIKGIYINGGMGAAGAASREEILKALRDFKKSGKWILSYADTYTQGDLLLAATADSVFLNPMGGVAVHGVAANVPFYTGLLDKIGVKMQIVRVGTFKSAVEPFFAKEMSPASRLQLQQTADTLWSFLSEGIAEGRGVAVADVDMWADSIISTWSAQRVLNAKAVTSLRYRRQVEDLLRKRLDIERDDELPLVTPADYMTTRKGASKDKDHVAVLFAVGDIVDQGNDGIVGEEMTPQIIKLADDEHVKGLVLRVNSG